MLLIAFLLIILAVILLILANRQRSKSGLPLGRVIYTDTSQWGRVEKPLYDPQSGLAGRPDYLVRGGQYVIPVEVKSSWAPPVPFENHIMQLAAYCLLVERTYGSRPPHGILKYRNRTYEIDYTPQLEASLIEVITRMRQYKKLEEIDRSHEDPARCARCGYRFICDQRV